MWSSLLYTWVHSNVITLSTSSYKRSYSSSLQCRIFSIMTDSDIKKLTHWLFKMSVKGSDSEDRKKFKKVKIKVSEKYYE